MVEDIQSAQMGKLADSGDEKQEDVTPSILFAVSVVDQLTGCRILGQELLQPFIQNEKSIEVTRIRFSGDEAPIQNKRSSDPLFTEPVPPIEQIGMSLRPLATRNPSEDRGNLLPGRGVMSFRQPTILAKLGE